MSLRNVQGRPIGASLQEGVIENTRDLKMEVLESACAAPTPITCEPEHTFGMPTWLSWMLLAIVIIAIITIVVSNGARGCRRGCRRK